MKRILLVTFFLLLGIFVKPANVLAEQINSFDVSITAHQNGQLSVLEKINYDFGNIQKHGIYRYIPLYSRVSNLYRIIQIQNVQVTRDGQKESLQLSSDNTNITFKIGNPNLLITGDHDYTISYDVLNAAGSNFPDHDEIYWNVTGNNWQVPIAKSTASISTDFPVTKKSTICYAGLNNSREKSCSVSGDVVSTTIILTPGDGLTVVAVYPIHTFPPSILSSNPPSSTFSDFLGGILSHIGIIFLILNIIIAPALIFWYEKTKNKKRFGPVTVNFDIPKDEKGNRLSPAIVGTIDTSKIEKDDVTATIFDLAIRKYIKLQETSVKVKALGLVNYDSKKQTITRLKENDGKLTDYEKTLFDRLFQDGNTIDISTLKNDFYITFQAMEKNVFKELVERKYYTKNPQVQRAILLVLGVFSLVTLNFILGIVLIFLSLKLNGRTPFGDEEDFKIDGLKLFLKSMERNYNWQAQNLYVVEQMIPYAMALGYIDKFMQQLKIAYPNYSPTWYVGTGSFYLGYAGFYSSFSTTIAPVASSGASGGFSGGGGGGGGGGSW